MAIRSVLSELTPVLPELLEAGLFGAITTVLSVAGIYTEMFALSSIQSGETTIGAWAVVAGLVLCGFGYLIATNQFRPKLKQLRTAMVDSK
jgi:hypothetical protein